MEAISIAPKLKVSCIVCDMTGYISETEKFEKENVVKEKHVSSQMVQMPNPARNVPGLKLPNAGGMITTVMITVVYIHEEKLS